MTKNELSPEEEIRVLHGSFSTHDGPSIKPRKIRLFLCAPFKGKSKNSALTLIVKLIFFLFPDTAPEVEHLFQVVFPKLRHFTRSRYGFEFQVIFEAFKFRVKIRKKR